MKMHHSKYKNLIFLNTLDNTVWKTIDQTATDIPTTEYWPDKWMCKNILDYRVDLD